jgi:hypothetical protein
MEIEPPLPPLVRVPKPRLLRVRHRPALSGG